MNSKWGSSAGQQQKNDQHQDLRRSQAIAEIDLELEGVEMTEVPIKEDISLTVPDYMAAQQDQNQNASRSDRSTPPHVGGHEWQNREVARRSSVGSDLSLSFVGTENPLHARGPRSMRSTNTTSVLKAKG